MSDSAVVVGTSSKVYVIDFDCEPDYNLDEDTSSDDKAADDEVDDSRLPEEESTKSVKVDQLAGQVSILSLDNSKRYFPASLSPLFYPSPLSPLTFPLSSFPPLFPSPPLSPFSHLTHRSFREEEGDSLEYQWPDDKQLPEEGYDVWGRMPGHEVMVWKEEGRRERGGREGKRGRKRGRRGRGRGRHREEGLSTKLMSQLLHTSNPLEWRSQFNKPFSN